MDCAIAQDWVVELRSDRWPQGTGKLRSKDNKYCCLGVLCEMAVKSGVIPPPRLCELDECGHAYGEVPANGHAPREVVVWSGMKTGWGDFGDGLTQSLALWNDNGRTFAEIADLIEQRWAEL